LREVPCIVKDIAEERILLESLVENLHRKDLTDIERENAIHNLWKNRETLGIESKAELAKVLGVSETSVQDDVEAWEFRHQEEGIPTSTPTYIISRTQGLPDAERKRIIEKVNKGELQAKEAYTAIKVLRNAPIVIRKELLKPKSRMTPKMAEAIVKNVPNEREQRKIVREIDQFRLTEDEVEDRIKEVSLASKDAPLQKEMVVQEGTVYTVGEYECPHCKRHYLIRCDGKRDWVE